MAYRISLHILVTFWHLLLLALAISLRKSHRYYKALVPVCLFSACYTLTWALGLIFESELFMRLTWVGAFWPAALYIFLREIFELPMPTWLRRGTWGLAIIVFLGGITPYCLVTISAYEPNVVAVYGPLEPTIRILLFIQIALIVVTSFKKLFSIGVDRGWATKFTLSGFLFYGVGAIAACSLLPLFGEYSLLETASFASVIWTTIAVWHVFKEMHEQNLSLVQLDEIKKVFINHITHEFRTPLSAIAGANDILAQLDTMDRKKLLEYTHMIDGNTTRLTGFVDELLDLAVIQQAKVQLHKSEVDLFQLIKRVSNRVSPLIEKESISFNLEGESLFYTCDEDKIEQVITNLISNAVKAAPGGKIVVTLKAEKKEITITVTDNGRGILAEHLPHLFSSFYRIAIKDSPHKGTGLGLAISKGWVEAHGGKIQATSKGVAQGSEFTVTLPNV